MLLVVSGLAKVCPVRVCAWVLAELEFEDCPNPLLSLSFISFVIKSFKQW